MNSLPNKSTPGGFLFRVDPPQTGAVVEAAAPWFHDLNNQRSGLEAVNIANLHVLDPEKPYHLDLNDISAAALVQRLFVLAQTTHLEAECQTFGRLSPDARAALNARCELGIVAVNLALEIQLVMQQRVCDEVTTFLIVEDLPFS